jgi:hypothetical protein
MLTRLQTKFRASNAAHRVSAPSLAFSAGERSVCAGSGSLREAAERDNSPQEISGTYHQLNSILSALRTSRSRRSYTHAHSHTHKGVQYLYPIAGESPWSLFFSFLFFSFLHHLFFFLLYIGDFVKVCMLQIYLYGIMTHFKLYGGASAGVGIPSRPVSCATTVVTLVWTRRVYN